ncbi:MAG: FHIPEP family type III secretion protein [Planctomycetes bacterium]|nr:FHIPEP family type III secretion protein [Planctomycetota bacterium]
MAQLPSPAMPGGVLGRLIASNDIVFAMGVAMVLATLLVPLPTFMMDVLLACSLAVSIATLIIVLSQREAIDFSTFPSLLLFLTLFRVALNVASTRLILMQGDAGHIILTFGNFVAGGSLVIGLVIFLIIVVIQFIVITKGAERISEVAARFNLDAMPGKQMAIDADLNAGLIGEDEAKARRAKIVKESEFYGAMDGASKFIRGDAVAGLVIVLVNICGGFLMGLSKDMSPAESIRRYVILAIGDGLVSQIPAVIVATASGFLITKTATQTSLSTDLVRQMLFRSRPIGIAAFLMGAMIFVPGFPKIPFALLAIGAGLLSRAIASHEKSQGAEKEKAKPKEAAGAKPDEIPIEELLDVDRICIQVGSKLIRLIDPRREGSLAHRITPLRRMFAQQFGIVLPLVRLRDNVNMDPNTYEIRINNHVVAGGRLEPEKLLAMDLGAVSKPVPGTAAQEPVFNLPALWITPDLKEQAEINGYTVVDPETIPVTHLSETLRRHACELLSRDDVQKLVDRLKEKQPAVVTGIVGEIVPMSLLHRVLQNLLRDGIPIRDLPQILETLGDNAPRTKDAAVLTELVRKRLARTITEQFSVAGKLTAIVLEPNLEYELRSSLAKAGEGETLAMAPDRTMELGKKISEAWTKAMEMGFDKAVMLCDYRVRPHLASLAARHVPQLPVLAYDEVVVGTRIDSINTVALQLRLQTETSPQTAPSA